MSKTPLVQGIYFSHFLGAASYCTKYISLTIKWGWFPVKYWYQYKPGTQNGILCIFLLNFGQCVLPVVGQKVTLVKRASKKGQTRKASFLVMFIHDIPVWAVFVGTSPWHKDVDSLYISRMALRKSCPLWNISMAKWWLWGKAVDWEVYQVIWFAGFAFAW